MPFEPGHTLATGRPKGSPNKENKELREAIFKMSSGKLSQANLWRIWVKWVLIVWGETWKELAAISKEKFRIKSFEYFFSFALILCKKYFLKRSF